MPVLDPRVTWVEADVHAGPNERIGVLVHALESLRFALDHASAVFPWRVRSEGP
ncbi:MAG TPA: hypothetical protein VGG28_29030 [Kofleriaceae bacterium]|jgi:hypothetical protein